MEEEKTNFYKTRVGSETDDGGEGGVDNVEFYINSGRSFVRMQGGEQN